MREFAFLVLLISACQATDDVLTDYWETNSDGVILDSQIPIKMFRESHSEEKKKMIRASLRHNIDNFMSLKGKSSNNNEVLDTFENVLKKYIRKNLTTGEARQCVDGPVKFIGCYKCFCIGGQVYVCSSENCPLIDDLSPTQEVAPTCVEGEEVQTDMCTDCRCLDSKVYCDISSCYDKENPINRLKKPKEKCEDGQLLPSEDNCNQCKCENGQKLCTTTVCGPIILTEYRHCEARQWHSLSTFNECKECYCVDGQMSFCYMDFRSKSFTKLDGTVQARCTRDQYFTLGTADTCQGCHCKKGRWNCCSINRTCSAFKDHRCPPGDLVKNDVSPCSVCYCSVDGMNMCTTDEHCAHVILNKASSDTNSTKKRRRCDSVLCNQKCNKRDKIGICIKFRGCVCN